MSRSSLRSVNQKDNQMSLWSLRNHLGGRRCGELGGGWGYPRGSQICIYIYIYICCLCIIDRERGIDRSFDFGFWAHFSKICHKEKLSDRLWLRSPKITEMCVFLLGGLAPSPWLSLLFPDHLTVSIACGSRNHFYSQRCLWFERACYSQCCW